MLYTGKGDDGKTTLFHCDQRFSKSSAIAEALGSLDELNSYLGIIRSSFGPSSDSLQSIQEELFIIQAGLAGADKDLGPDKVGEIERKIAEIEKEIPPITSFTIPGATEESARYDFVRTLARKAERRVVTVVEEGKVKISETTLAYLNRLSSLLFALARQSAYRNNSKETSPSYR